MAERYSASQEPFPTSTFSDDNRQPRVAGRYEGFDNPTPVAGRVAGRYDGFDSGVSPTGRGVGNPPAPTGGSYGQPAGSLSGTPTGGRVAGSYDQPTGLLYGNPTPGRIAGTYDQPAGPLSGTPTGGRVGGSYNQPGGPLSGTPTGGRVGGSYDQPAAPLSGTPTGGRVGGNYDQPAGLFYGTPTGGRAGSSYGQPAGPISGTPAPGRVGGSYNQPAGSLSSTPAPGRVAGSYDQPAGSLSGTPTPGRVEIPSDVNPRVVTPTGNRGDGKSSGPAPRYDPAPPAQQGGADRSAPAPAMDLNRSDPPPSTVRRRRAAPGEQRTTMTNDGATNDSARRKEDDTETGQGQMMGVTGLLRNPRNRLYLATLVAATPFLISFAFYVSQFSFFGQFIIGVLCGLCIQAVYMLYSLHRKHQRKSRTVKIAQMATLDADQLKILLPTAESFPKWISFTAFERMDWLNKTMTKLWPYIDQAASDLIKQKVQPILDQYAMGVIQKLELKEVAFGNKAPQVTGVRLTEGLEDETVLEIKILWNTSKEGVVLSVDFPGPNYKVQLKNWHLEGTAKLIFKPLTGTIPGFGAVLVSLTEPPDFDFDLKFLGGDIGALPGVEKMIDNSIRTALMDSLVWPSRIVIPMIPGGDFSFLELHPVGELDVMVVEAKNIKNTDLLGKADPFVTLFVRQTKDKIKRSTTKKNTLKPVWNENFKLEVEDPESQRLTLRLMDDESVEKSEYIGTVALAIKEFKPHVRTELWCDVLEDPESHAPDQIRGSVHIVVTYNPYSRDEVVAKRGYNETEKKIYEEQQIILEQKKREHKTAGEAPKQQGNITQHPAEKPRAPGPTAEL